jgi:ubiquinol-cytochrome c reductase cytochrome b subunit
MSLSFYILLWVQGGNDLIASTFDVDVFLITWTMRAAIFVVPPLVFVITKRICFGLQRRDRDKLLHGYESGVIKRLPSGKYYEQHQPISEAERAVILARHDAPLPLPTPQKYDENGIKQKGYGVKLLQAKLSQFFYDERLPVPTAAEIAEANHHEAEITSERDDEIDDARVKALAPHE